MDKIKISCSKKLEEIKTKESIAVHFSELIKGNKIDWL